MTDKALVVDALQKLPDDSTFQDVKERVEFMVAVNEGLQQIMRGEVTPLDEVERKLGTWFSEQSFPCG